MGYRPICDTWILARARLSDGTKFYGSYPGGYLERARALLGVHISDPVLHVCSGMVRLYPYKRGFGPNDKTLDLDPATKPDFLQDARDPFPLGFKAILMDPPYSEADADHYTTGALLYPKPRTLINNALNAIEPGCRVGILHYLPPRPPKGTIYVASVKVELGFDNRVRQYSVFEKEFPDPIDKTG